MTQVGPSEGRLAVFTATGGTVLIAGGAFWLSFTALSDLARRSGVGGGQAWAWPLIVDGLIVVATVAVVALDRHKTAWYPWLLLAAATLVSVTANALHATVTADPDVPDALAGCVAAVPPLVLLASTHLTVVLLRARHAADAGTEAGTAADPAPSGVERELPAVIGGAVPAPGVGRRGLAATLRGEGWSNKRIAGRLGVAPSTVGRWFAAPDTLQAPGEDELHEEETV